MSDVLKISYQNTLKNQMSLVFTIWAEMYWNAIVVGTTRIIIPIVRRLIQRGLFLEHGKY
ncbi:hypothetical protein B879_00166 [Cecembia lonarensis LW9]|uniref:Uncharacterized protein n=1 Tax=Cecembia lonarensis (strain CCUG 58316 / KCTC 22772 / LW9) TaxID=1225176 RepID=K1L3U1_CECL9|nr:hypothetical protein B879_00166 [Cecembia lonarensis LW9]